MSGEIAAIEIVRSDAAIGSMVGGTGTSARVYPLERPQGSTFPSVVISTDDIEPYDTKSGVSKLDDDYIIVRSYAKTYSNVSSLSSACRTALDRTTGTYNSVVVQSIRFEDSDSWAEEIEGSIIYVVEHTYKTRIER